MNALTKAMEAELRDTFAGLDGDDSVRVIVLTGLGRAFCAGMDIDELEVLPPDDIRAAHWMRPYDMNRRADYQGRYAYFPAVRKPLISAINGAAASLGLIFALYSDMRFASDKAVFSTAFAKRWLSDSSTRLSLQRNFSKAQSNMLTISPSMCRLARYGS